MRLGRLGFEPRMTVAQILPVREFRPPWRPTKEERAADARPRKHAAADTEQARLVARLRSRGWTMPEIAKAAGVGKSSVWRWTIGAPISARLLMRLREAAR